MHNYFVCFFYKGLFGEIVCVVVKAADTLSLFLAGLRFETCSDRQVPPSIGSGVKSFITSVHVHIYFVFRRVSKGSFKPCLFAFHAV